MISHKYQEFYVHNIRDHNPLFKHTSLDNAETEALCLAKLNPGSEFQVLKVLTGYKVDALKRTIYDVDIKEINHEGL